MKAKLLIPIVVFLFSSYWLGQISASKLIIISTKKKNQELLKSVLQEFTVMLSSDVYGNIECHLVFNTRRALNPFPTQLGFLIYYQGKFNTPVRSTQKKELCRHLLPGIRGVQKQLDNKKNDPF